MEQQQDGETVRLLRETLELEKENNKMLKKIRRSSLITTIVTIVYWSLLIGVPVYLYYSYMRPYMDQLTHSYEEIKSQIGYEGKIPFLPESIERFFGLDSTEAVSAEATTTKKK